MSEDIKQLLDNIKHLTYFDVVIELTEPLEFNGVIPFDIIISNNVATFNVLASSQEDAEQKVFEYLWK